MEHGFYLIIEYLALPSAFMFVPRLNQFISDRLNGLTSKFFELKWDWKLELSIVYFLSYIALIFRLNCENSRTSFFAEVFIPLFEIALLIIFYVRLTIPNNNHKDFSSIKLCILFGCILLFTILIHETSLETFKLINENILKFLKAVYDSTQIEFAFIFILCIVVLGTIIRSVKFKKRSKNSLQTEFLGLQENQDVGVEHVMHKFENYEAKYVTENQGSINYWMQKVSYLVKTKYILTAMHEIATLKQSKTFASAPTHIKDAVIRFELELLLNAKEYWKAKQVIFEFSDLNLQKRYLKLIPHND